MGSRFDSCEERGREIIEKLSKKTEPITGKAAESVSKVGKCVADKANDVNGFVREIADYCGIHADVPVFAIGGITPENIGLVKEAGAKGGCMMSYMMSM